MSGYDSPKNFKTFTSLPGTKEKSPNKNYSNVKINNIRATFEQLIDEVTDKKDTSIKAATQVYKTNHDLKHQLLSEQNSNYVEFLEEDLIQMKKRLNQEIKKNIELMKKIDIIENQQMDNGNPENNIDLEIQNKALKSRLLKLNEDYNKLYYELQTIKQQNNTLRKQTVSLLNKK